MLWVTVVLTLLMGLPNASAVAQSDQTLYGGSPSISRDRFINQFKNNTGRENVQYLSQLQSRSLYEFNRNLSWLKGYAKAAIWDQEFGQAFTAFLEELADDMRFFPDDILLLARVIEGLGETATPIGSAITFFLEINWYQQSLMNFEPQVLLEATLILLKWHKDVELYYSAEWRLVAQDVAVSEVCQSSPSCVERTEFLLRGEDNSYD